MKLTAFLQQSSNLFAANRLLRFVVLVLALALVANSFLVYRAVRYQRVILIPPHMTGTVEFVQGRPTQRYLEELSQRIISLATTYSPHTARRQFNELLVYFSPEVYPEAARLWYSLAGRIEESQVSSVFYPEKTTIKKDSIEVFGTLRQFAGTTPLDNTTRTYRIEYRIKDGRLLLLSLREKEQPALEGSRR